MKAKYLYLLAGIITSSCSINAALDDDIQAIQNLRYKSQDARERGAYTESDSLKDQLKTKLSGISKGAYTIWQGTSPKTAQEWEAASQEFLKAHNEYSTGYGKRVGSLGEMAMESDYTKAPSKLGKYVESAQVGLHMALQKTFGSLAQQADTASDSLQIKIGEASDKGENASIAAYKALQSALNSAANVGLTIASVPIMATGIAYGLVSHLGLDIVDLFRATQAKLANNSLSPQEAAQIANEIQEKAEELKEEISDAQKQSVA